MSRPIRPVTGFFLERMRLIDELQRSRDYYGMFEEIRNTIDNLHPDDIDGCKDIEEKLDDYLRQINSIRGRHWDHTQKLRSGKAAQLYNNGGRDAKRTFYNVLYTGGYIDIQAFDMYYPAEQKPQ